MPSPSPSPSPSYMVGHDETIYIYRPNTKCLIKYGPWRFALIGQYMVGHDETIYDSIQDPIPNA